MKDSDGEVVVEFSEFSNSVATGTTNNFWHSWHSDCMFIAEDHQGRVYKDLDAVFALIEVSPILWPVQRLATRVRFFYSLAQRILERSHYHPPKEVLYLNINKQRKSQSFAYRNKKGKVHRSSLGSLVSEVWFYVKFSLWNITSLLFLLYILGLNAGNMGYKNWTPPYEAQVLMSPFSLSQTWR